MGPAVPSAVREPPPGTCAVSLNGEAAVGETLVSSALSCW